MKKLMIFLFCAGLISTGWAQTDHAIVENPTSMAFDDQTDQFSFAIPEVYVSAFHSNPLEYVKNNFDIQQLVKDNDSKYDSYYVYFRSSKGKLVVNYDGDGKIISTRQKFKNVALPHESKLFIHENYGNWEIAENKYVASSWNGNIKREFYKVKLQNGEETKTLKLEVDQNESRLGLALK
jgi:hypothetical protein